jgi:hypothetical protein
MAGVVQGRAQGTRLVVVLVERPVLLHFASGHQERTGVDLGLSRSRRCEALATLGRLLLHPWRQRNHPVCPISDLPPVWAAVSCEPISEPPKAADLLASALVR